MNRLSRVLAGVAFAVIIVAAGIWAYDKQAIQRKLRVRALALSLRSAHFQWQRTRETLPLRIDEVLDVRERSGSTFFPFTNSVVTKTGQLDILLGGRNSSLGKGLSLLISKQGVLFIVERDGTLSAYQPK